MKGVFRYPGSKNKVADEIISYFPDHDKYIEVFGGSAAVLVRKPLARVEVYNDLKSELVNLFQVLTYKFDEFKEKAKWVVNSRDWFYQIRKKEPTGDSVIDALNTYYILKYGFAGRRSGWTVNIKQNGSRVINFKFLESVHQRLERVQFTNFEFEKVIKKFDDHDTLFYLDPPYPGMGELYGVEFNTENFENILTTIKGQWILSYPVQLEQWYNKEIEIQYSLKTRENVTEYLISNFPLVKGTMVPNLMDHFGGEEF